jgi:p-cumate 2,3-dioxygenase beta subunit
MTTQELELDGTPLAGEDLRAVEQYLYEDAELLDTWQLHQWLARFAVDGRYLVPTTDLPQGDPTKDLFLVQDDRFLLEQRVNSLLTRAAHAEYPHSQTRRLITNIRARALPDGQTLAIANFAIFRMRTGVFDTYVGQHRILLERDSEQGFLMAERRSVLDLVALRPHGKVSIIL